MFTTLGHRVARRPWPVQLAALALVIVAALGATGLSGRLSHGGYLDPGTEAARATQAVRDRVGSGGADIVVLFRSPGLSAFHDSRFQATVEASLAGAPTGTIASVMTYWNTQNAALVSADQNVAIAAIMLAGADDTQRVASYRTLRAALSAPGFQLSYTGPIAVLEEIAERSQHELHRLELIALPLVALLLLVVFRGVVAALLPVLVGGLTTVTTLGAIHLVATVTDFSATALVGVVAVGLAFGIDAALFVVSRFREELTRQDGVPDAVAATVATAGRTVFFSGMTISGIVLALLFFPLALIRSFGIGAAIAAALGAIISVTVLPAVLAVLGHRVNALRVGRTRSTGGGAAWWAKLARTVMKDPVPYVAGVLAVLVLLTIPFFHTLFAFPDEQALPPDAPARTATEEVRRDFAFGTLAAVQVVTTFAEPLDTPRGAAALKEWSARLVTTPGTNRGHITAKAGQTAVIYMAYEGRADDPGAAELVRRIRALPAPAGAQVLVGGQTAMATDTVDRILDRLGWALLYAAISAFLLLMVSLRSIVLPLKALVVNALSLGASFGVLTWMFQDGNLLWLVGGTPTGHIDLFQPVTMLFIVIALAVDYELFLLCRVREEYDAHGDNTAAVAFGLQQSGPVITAAALVVLAVFTVFAASDVTLVKQLCVGMAIAVVLDASIVRLLLVPAMMRLLGRANWWLPGRNRPGPSNTRPTTSDDSSLTPYRGPPRGSPEPTARTSR